LSGRKGRTHLNIGQDTKKRGRSKAKIRELTAASGKACLKESDGAVPRQGYQLRAIHNFEGKGTGGLKFDETTLKRESGKKQQRMREERESSEGG